MVTYEEAYKKAVELRPDIDYYTEFEKGWLFGARADEEYDGGAGHTPVIIVKASGKVVNAPTFYMVIGPGKILQEDVQIDEAGRNIP